MRRLLLVVVGAGFAVFGVLTVFQPWPSSVKIVRIMIAMFGLAACVLELITHLPSINSNVTDYAALHLKLRWAASAFLVLLIGTTAVAVLTIDGPLLWKLIVLGAVVIGSLNWLTIVRGVDLPRWVPFGPRNDEDGPTNNQRPDDT